MIGRRTSIQISDNNELTLSEESVGDCEMHDTERYPE